MLKNKAQIVRDSMNNTERFQGPSTGPGPRPYKGHRAGAPSPPK